MIVDIHTHIWDSPRQLGPDAVARMQRRANGPWDRPNASFKAFDEAIVPLDYAVVLGVECRAQDASIPHEQVMAHVKRHAGRCVGFAGIDPLAPDYLESLDRAASLGLVGVTVSPAVAAFHPTHSRAMRLYEQCQERGLPVLFHPGTHFGVASHLEYSRPVLLDEVARSFPTLRMVIAQVGHPWVAETLLLLSKHEHVYADLSLLTQRPWELYNALLAAYHQGATDRLLLGSDFPFLTPKQAILNIYSANSFTQGTPLPPVPREQLRSIVERDALACLGIRAPAAPAKLPAETSHDNEAEPRIDTENESRQKPDPMMIKIAAATPTANADDDTENDTSISPSDDAPATPHPKSEKPAGASESSETVDEPLRLVDESSANEQPDARTQPRATQSEPPEDIQLADDESTADDEDATKTPAQSEMSIDQDNHDHEDESGPMESASRSKPADDSKQ